MAEGIHYFVRHGKTGSECGDQGPMLNREGKAQAEEARDYLIRRGLGHSTIVLSSDLSRATETATIIADGLGTTVLSSRRINIAGNEPTVIRDMDDFLVDTLDSLGENIDNRKLVVVTHAPLLAVLVGRPEYDTDMIGYGEVFTYTPGNWNSSMYDEDLAAMLL
jgi:phosphohistidine phosphatase SixA